jgi:DNA-damage-inducible protein D
VWSYNIETVIAEKLETILRRAEANSRIRDYYDLYLIYTKGWNDVKIDDLRKAVDKTFEDIKHINEYGNEFWYARELMQALEYKRWDKFNNVINNAKIACEKSKHLIENHFSQVGKMVEIGSKTSRTIKDYELSRYACYLIVQNADPKKESVALGQTYFAVQTRRQEISEQEYSNMSEDEKRFYQRNLTKKGNYSLNRIAVEKGVKNLDRFHNAGYKGLYNGETADDIARRKKLRYREDILDNMGSDELIANLFRISQTEQKLKKEIIKNEQEANEIHYEVGSKIRKTIKELGGTMPEDLPTPKKSLKELEKEKKLEIK